MEIHTNVEIDLNSILLDPINPRHEPLQPQTELIKIMVDLQKEKVLRLAEDIVRHGLNPTDLISVIPHPSERSKFTVVEGNRRITALKLLNLPSLCHDEQLRKRFELLSKELAEKPIGKFKCICFKDRESAKHWISLKHTGENGGVGTVDWKAPEVKRFQAQEEGKKESRGLQLMNFLLNNLQLDQDARAALKKMPITTVERMLNDPRIRDFLGLNFKDGILASMLTKEAAAQTLYQFFQPILIGDKKVTDVYYKENRDEYMAGFGTSPASNPENLAKKAWPLNAPLTSPPTLKTEKTTPVVHLKSKPLTANRNFIIPQSCILKISTQRINNIYGELKSKLHVDEAPNACSVLLRVFLETSTDVYMKNNGVASGAQDDLKKKLLNVADYMESKKIATRDELKPVRNAASVPNGLFSTHTLNAYVHGASLNPKASELKATWDDMEGFIKKIWES